MKKLVKIIGIVLSLFFIFWVFNAFADDYGDAPSPYPTASAGPSFYGWLGLYWDDDAAYPNPVPPAWTGDDITPSPSSDDEDGLFSWISMFPGSATGSVAVVLYDIGSGSTAYINLWIDFNNDGD